MITRIISGGQTGADRAGLDAAIELGLDHGGWCPKGRRSEDGPIDFKYNLSETQSYNYKERTEFNIMEADATWVFCSPKNRYSPGTELTIKLCREFKKSYQILWFEKKTKEEFDELIQLASKWLIEYDISILNIAGNRESVSPGIYSYTKTYMVETINVLTAAYKNSRI